jgi:hypothetical protein
MVFYHGECGLRDPRIHSLSGGEAAGTISDPEGMLTALSFPAIASAGWKESGLAEEPWHLDPTRNGSLDKE